MLDQPRLERPRPARRGGDPPVRSCAALLAEEAVRSGVRIRLGVTITELIQRPDAVEVTLTDSSRSTYDLVVGADGLRSAVRGMVMPGAPQPRFSWPGGVAGDAAASADAVYGPAMYYGPETRRA